MKSFSGRRTCTGSGRAGSGKGGRKKERKKSRSIFPSSSSFCRPPDSPLVAFAGVRYLPWLASIAAYSARPKGSRPSPFRGRLAGLQPHGAGCGLTLPIATALETDRQPASLPVFLPAAPPATERLPICVFPIELMGQLHQD